MKLTQYKCYKSLVIKIVFLLFSINILAANADDTEIQFIETKISLDFEKTPLLEIFSKIEMLTSYTFFYKNDDVNLEKKITIKVIKEPLNNILLKILESENLSFKVIYNQIIINNSNSIVQNKNEIMCRVIEMNTGCPIVFATVRIKGKNNGVIADEEGYFRLPYRYKEAKDTIVISSIGYKTKEIPIINLKSEGINTIRIESKIEELTSVTLTVKSKTGGVKTLTGRDIVKQAIESIPINYPSTPSSYIGYYRDYQLLNNEYFNLNEGIIETFDAGFQTDSETDNENQTILYRYKLNQKFKQDSTITIPYDNDKYKFIENAVIIPKAGNELNILNAHNPIRNYKKNSFSFVNVFKEDFLYNHEFKIEKKLFLNNIPIYQIKFKAKNTITGIKYAVEGTIYISAKNFSIHKLEYDVYDVIGIKNKKYDGLFLNDTKLKLSYSLKVEYIPKRERMYLNYISFNNRFRIGSKHDFIIKNINFDLQENSFFITFSNAVDEASIRNIKNFKFSHKNKRLSIKRAELVEKKVLKVILVQGTIKDFDAIQESNMEDFKYKIKNIKDLTGRDLDRLTKIEINQFRELFVQEVFPEKLLPKDVAFMLKNANLSKSEIMKSDLSSKYWINTPLKKKN